MAWLVLPSACGELGVMGSRVELDGPIVVSGIQTPLDLSEQDVDAEPREIRREAPSAAIAMADPDAVRRGQEGAGDTMDDAPESSRDDAERPESLRSAPPALGPERVLMATSWQTFIYDRPDFGSAQIGYLRSGTVVERASRPEGFGSCAKGFYPVEPRGYVCVGKAAKVEPVPELAAVPRQPHREEALPHVYASTGKVAPGLYTRIPELSEKPRAFEVWRSLGLRTAAPEFLADGSPSLRSNGERMSELSLIAGRAVPRSSFALIELFEHEGRGWGLTTDLLLLPLDRVEPVRPSEFHGVGLEGSALPLAFVMDRDAVLYGGSPRRGLRLERRLAYREAVLLTGLSERVGGTTYRETRDGHWLVDSESLTVIGPRQSAPGWAKSGRRWLDVSLVKQTLVAYVGEAPVFATLVSTGLGGAGDPATTRATVQGEYLIHTKHVTETLASDADGDVFDHRDVPYVQFFKDGYALHSAHWHDAFGKPRSHGCINLSPRDARWLFEWTDPQVPDAWHGAMSLRDGTLISIHP